MGVTVTPSFAQLRNKPTTVAGFGIADMASQTCGAVPFSGVTGKPTTMTGYGITDEKCKAWVNFNGTGVVAIRAAFNVSSITDNGVGDYTVNFATAMPDDNYSFVLSGTNFLNGVATGFFGVQGSRQAAPINGSLRLKTFGTDNGLADDMVIVNAVIFR